MPTNDEAHDHDAEVIEALEVGRPLPAPILDRAEIDVQIATAKQYPRSIVAFKRAALEMATLDEETAGTMFYVLPRGGKRIEGPGVRLAEIAASAWGNMRYGARVISIGERYVRAQGMAYDLERNVAYSVEVSRRITDRSGKRYDDDMIGVTSNAACAIAGRNSVFKVIPFSLIKDIYEQAKQVSLGKALTMEQRRNRALEWFGKIGAKPEQVLRIVNRKGIEDLTVDDLLTLQGIKTAIADGDTTLADVLRETAPEKGPEQPKGSRLDALTDKLSGASPATPPATPPIEQKSAPIEAAAHPAVDARLEWPAGAPEAPSPTQPLSEPSPEEALRIKIAELTEGWTKVKAQARLHKLVKKMDVSKMTSDELATVVEALLKTQAEDRANA